MCSGYEALGPSPKNQLALSSFHILRQQDVKKNHQQRDEKWKTDSFIFLHTTFRTKLIWENPHFLKFCYLNYANKLKC